MFDYNPGCSDGLGFCKVVATQLAPDLNLALQNGMIILEELENY